MMRTRRRSIYRAKPKHGNFSRYKDWKEMHDRNDRIAKAIVLSYEMHKDDRPKERPMLIDRIKRIFRIFVKP